MAVRDTHLPRVHTDVWAEVKPRCEAALSAIGASGAVYARTVPDQQGATPPFCILRGEQDDAPAYETHDKYGIRFDLEVFCVAADQTTAEKLAGEVTERVTDLDSPPEPDGLQHLYTKPLADIPSESLAAGQSDLFNLIVRQRLIYRTE